MPKVAKGQRKRAYRPKTTTGCLTCKARRIKCDELRPRCLKCKSASRVCEGYYDGQPPHSSPTNVISIIAGPSSEIRASTQAHRSFSFFVQRTSPQLAGFFGSDFWERVVLQTAYHESAVRHAVVAIGSLHELFEHQSPMIDADKAFALKEYNLAIKDLVAPLDLNKQRRIDVCIISCILFICFENMQSHHASAGLHIRSGAKLLREIVYDERNGTLRHQSLGSQSRINSYASPEVLGRVFTGLDPRTILVVESDELKLHEKLFSGATDDDVPLTFSDVEEAKNMFEYGRGLFMNSHGVPLSLDTVDSLATFEAHVNHIAALLSKFSLGLQNLSESKGPFLTRKEDIAISVLRLHVLDAHISVLVDQIPPNTLPQWDKVKPHMEEIIVLGEKIISSTSPDGHQKEDKTSFCLGMGIIIPLFTVATRCQDLFIRRKAIALLRSTSRQEGLWNSLLTAKAAERTMEIEESLCEEVIAYTDSLDVTKPPSVKPFFELDANGGRLRYFKLDRVANMYLNVVEEIFSWDGP